MVPAHLAPSSFVSSNTSCGAQQIEAMAAHVQGASNNYNVVTIHTLEEDEPKEKPEQELQGPYDQFVAVESSSPTDEASRTLVLCQNYIVSPYNILLLAIGWRKFQTESGFCSSFSKVFNIGYPVFIVMMLILACIAQVSSCFSRTKSTVTLTVGPSIISNGSNVSGNSTGDDESFNILRCDSHFVTLDIISYLLIFVAYFLAFYSFRVTEPEHLSSLADTALLSFNDVPGSKSRKKPFLVLLVILFCGVVFFCFSIGVNICRLYSLRLHESNTIIGWFSTNLSAENQTEVLKLSMHNYKIVHYFLVVFAYLGFMFFDLLYIAVTINYCSQCQLLTFYIDNIQEKVRNKNYPDLKMAIKEINGVNRYLKILNGNISLMASFVIVIFLSSVILSYSSLVKPHQHTINIITGFLNTTQWLVAALFPTLLAVRLTASGNELRRLGQDIAARPFCYSDTPEFELQFFQTFTESTRYEARLAFIPMQPSLVLGFGFILLVLISSGTIIAQVESVMWF